MFATAVLRQTVKLHAREVGANVREVVEDCARSLLEGVCGESGFVRPSSLRMVGMSHGRLGDIDMGRSYSFDATFKAEVCNPVRGLRINALVRSINRFGMLCEGGYYDPDNSLVPVIEVVVVRNPATFPNEVDLGNLQIGDEVGVEILGRNYELRDSRISAFGRTIKDAGDTSLLRSLRDGADSAAPADGEGDDSTGGDDDNTSGDTDTDGDTDGDTDTDGDDGDKAAGGADVDVDVDVDGYGEPGGAVSGGVGAGVGVDGADYDDLLFGGGLPDGVDVEDEGFDVMLQGGDMDEDDGAGPLSGDES
eukprot:jgi/Tetstr1/461888/TSEL_006966.t1